MERKPGELDLDKAQWIIPAHKSKSRRRHLVPLPPAAVAILRTTPEFSGRFVFTTTSGERPISGFSKAKARINEAVAKVIAEQGADGVEPWTWHDLRRTCSTGMAGLGVPEIVRERALNHLPKGLSAVYNVHDYKREKRDALEAWAAHLEVILSGKRRENVVRLQAG